MVLKWWIITVALWLLWAVLKAPDRYKIPPQFVLNLFFVQGYCSLCQALRNIVGTYSNEQSENKTHATWERGCGGGKNGREVWVRVRVSPRAFFAFLFTPFYWTTLHHYLGAWNRLGLLLLMMSSPIPRWKNTNTTTTPPTLVCEQCPGSWGETRGLGVGWVSPPVPFSSHFFSVWIPLSLFFLAFSLYLSLKLESLFILALRLQSFNERNSGCSVLISVR